MTTSSLRMQRASGESRVTCDLREGQTRLGAQVRKVGVPFDPEGGACGQHNHDTGQRHGEAAPRRLGSELALPVAEPAFVLRLVTQRTPVEQRRCRS